MSIDFTSKNYVVDYSSDRVKLSIGVGEIRSVNSRPRRAGSRDENEI